MLQRSDPRRTYRPEAHKTYIQTGTWCYEIDVRIQEGSGPDAVYSNRTVLRIAFDDESARLHAMRFAGAVTVTLRRPMTYAQ